MYMNFITRKVVINLCHNKGDVKANVPSKVNKGIARGQETSSTFICIFEEKKNDKSKLITKTVVNSVFFFFFPFFAECQRTVYCYLELCRGSVCHLKKDKLSADESLKTAIACINSQEAFDISCDALRRAYGFQYDIRKIMLFELY